MQRENRGKLRARGRDDDDDHEAAMKFGNHKPSQRHAKYDDPPSYDEGDSRGSERDDSPEDVRRNTDNKFSQY